MLLELGPDKSWITKEVVYRKTIILLGEGNIKIYGEHKLINYKDLATAIQ